MTKINFTSVLKWLIFLLPALGLLYLGYVYKDNFYYLVSLISLLFGLLFSKPETNTPKKGNLIIKSFNNIKSKFEKLFTKNKSKKIRKISNAPTELKKTTLKYFTFVPTFLILQFYFQYLIIFELPNADGINSYLSNFASQLFENWTASLTILGFSLIATHFITSGFTKNRFAIRGYVVALLLSIIISPVLVFIIAFFHMNLISLQARVNPGSLGIENNRDKVIEKVKKLEEAPQIINSAKKDGTTVVVAILSKSNSKYGQYYINTVLTRISNNLIYKISIDTNSLLLLGNHLFISEINKNDIELLSPILGKLFISSSLDSRYIKDPPIVKVLGRQEYLKYREEKINKQIEKIDNYISEAEKNVSILYTGISNAKNNISSSQTNINESIAKRDSFHSSCTSAGYYSYYLNQFYRSFSDEYCNSGKAEWDAIISKYEQNIKENQNYLEYAQKELPRYQAILQQFKDVRDNTNQQKSSTPYELGLFEPDNEIRIALDETSSNRLADYFSTLVHEYYHYTSYVSEEKVLPRFFEEGLTEYFARKSISKTLGINTNEGYPGLVLVISEMAKKISDEKLLDIYLTKNYEALVGELNNAYGEKFYTDSSLYFDVIPFMDAGSSLKYINDILFRIGGKEVNENDLYSKKSDIN